MNLYTRNPTANARRIARVGTRRVSSPGYVYTGSQGAISFQVNGNDDVTYYIELDDNDLKELFKARFETYFEHFEKKD